MRIQSLNPESGGYNKISIVHGFDDYDPMEYLYCIGEFIFSV